MPNKSLCVQSSVRELMPQLVAWTWQHKCSAVELLAALPASYGNLPPGPWPVTALAGETFASDSKWLRPYFLRTRFLVRDERSSYYFVNT